MCFFLEKIVLFGSSSKINTVNCCFSLIGIGSLLVIGVDVIPFFWWNSRYLSTLSCPKQRNRFLAFTRLCRIQREQILFAAKSSCNILFIDACHTNFQKSFNYTICHMMILVYQFRHNIEIFWYKSCFLQNLTECALDK